MGLKVFIIVALYNLYWASGGVDFYKKVITLKQGGLSVFVMVFNIIGILVLINFVCN